MFSDLHPDLNQSAPPIPFLKNSWYKWDNIKKKMEDLPIEKRKPSISIKLTYSHYLSHFLLYELKITFKLLLLTFDWYQEIRIREMSII